MKTNGSLPNITGEFIQFRSTTYPTISTVTGCFTGTTITGSGSNAQIDAPSKQGAGNLDVYFDASKSSAIYNSNNTGQVRPKSMLIAFVIKY